MNNCVWCLEKIVTYGWKAFLYKKSPVCHKCFDQLEWIKGHCCHKCSKNISVEASICEDCLNWETRKGWQHVLSKNTSLFSYNPFMKQLISRFKFRGDYEIVYGFERMIYEKVHHLMKDAIVVPIPLGKERLIERGFNQAEAIAAQFPCKTFHLLTRSASEEKQSKKSKQERLQTNQPLFNVDFIPKSLKEKKILIVDDIYTTGTTIRHAAKALIKAGVKDISSFTLVRS